MTTAQFCILAAIVLYLVVTILIGVYFSRQGSGDSSDQFYLGGRKLGPIVTAMSAEASDMSSYLLMGLPGLAYLCGVAEVGWTVIGLAVGTYLNWLIVARRLRRYSAQLGAFTLPSFFSRRYKDDRQILSCIAAVVILIFFVPYTASGFKAVGTLFNSLFSVDYHVAMIVGAVVIIGYTVLGGFMAVSTTDLIQSIVMTIALLVIVVFGVGQAGGLDVVMDNARALPGYLNLTQGYNAATGTAATYGGLSIVSTLAWGLGYFGMPHILLRFMAIRDEKELTTSRRIASVWVAISMFVAIAIGVIGYSVSVAGKIPFLTTSAESETIIVRLSDLMSRHGLLLAVIAGIVLAGILASTMSTADSQLLAAASSVSQDLLQDFFHIKLSQKAAMLAARGTVIIIALIGMALAWDPNSSVFGIVSFAWAGFGAAFGPVMLMALFWRRSNKWGALAGMVSGGAMVFIWKYGVAKLGGAWAIYELLPAFIVGCVAIVVVSLLTPAPEKAVTDAFDAAGK
ncbi:sodium/proline symporter [Vermiculatibacterium agrestimuris]|uniref:sodium/proline symporter n=1 Tax=Vermiculatibacterium agrestimuris TaxID=2941519 RepID=UPI00203CF9CF|nr:sodium/proline symporter [Vermiculatibacterium agrestimuris]